MPDTGCLFLSLLSVVVGAMFVLFPDALQRLGRTLNRTLAVQVPRERVAQLHVTAKLMYRKADQFLLNFLFGKESGLTAPVTVMSEDRKTIRVTSE